MAVCTPEMQRTADGWTLRCPDCYQWWQVAMNTVFCRPNVPREESVLAAIATPGVADDVRAHVRQHHRGRLPWLPAHERSPIMALSAYQLRRGKEKLARKHGVAVTQVSDADVDTALNSGALTAADCGSYTSGSSSYDSGGSSSSYDSGSSSSSSGSSSGGGCD